MCGPQSLLPDDETLKGCVVGDDFDAMLEGADALMMLRLQRERMEEGLVPSLEQYHAQYGLTNERLARAGKDAAVLHPGPINRGVEVTDDVADGPQSWVLRQSPTASPCAWPCWKPCWADHFGGCRPLVGAVDLSSSDPVGADRWSARQICPHPTRWVPTVDRHRTISAVKCGPGH